MAPAVIALIRSEFMLIYDAQPDFVAEKQASID